MTAGFLLHGMSNKKDSIPLFGAESRNMIREFYELDIEAKSASYTAITH